MEKKKIIIVAVTLVLLVILVVLGFRLVQGALFRSAKMIQEAGERPLATEDVWVSPTFSLEDYDQPAMPPPEETPAPDPTNAPEEEDLQSVPVDALPEDLEDTAPESSIVEDDEDVG